MIAAESPLLPEAASATTSAVPVSEVDVNRYAPERKEHVQPNAYCPYGLGPHTCLGATTADLLYLVISAVLFRHFHVAMQPPDQALHIVMNPLPAPDDRFRISVTGERCPPPRSPAQAPAS